MLKLKVFAVGILIILNLSLVGLSCSVKAENLSMAEVAVELSTGKILHSLNEKKRLPMASTTKIMTAILIIEECNLDEEFIVSDESVGVEGSSVYLKKGEKINVIDLLYGLMLRSGNDAAHALAIKRCGTVSDFVALMNEKAKKIGATDTNFTNPSGLPNDNHYTTASDLCKIACYAMKNETFKKIVSTKNYSGKFKSYVNKNKILNLCEGANGVKTGYTQKAGRCLVSSVERGGMDVVCVVLNSPEMYERSAKIIDDCFSKYELKTINKDKVFLCKNTPCSLLNNVNLVVEKGIELNYNVLCQTEFEKNKDGIVGKLNIYSKNCLLFSENLYSI